MVARKTRKRKLVKKIKTKKISEHKNETEILLEKEEETPVSLVVFKKIQKKIDEQDERTNEDIKADFLKSFETPYLKKRFDPNNNFYEYVTNEWMKSIKTGIANQTNAKYDNFTLVQNKVDEQLYDIVEDVIRDKTPFAENLKNFMESIKNGNDINSSLKAAKELTTQIDDWRKDPANIWKYFAAINRTSSLRQQAFFYFKTSPDEMEPSVMRVHLNMEQFSNVEKAFYQNVMDKTEYNKIKKAKLKFNSDTFKTIWQTSHIGSAAQDAFDTHNECYMVALDAQKSTGYYKIYKDEALPKYGIDWIQFATELGYKEVPEFFITSNIEYLTNIVKLLKDNWTTDRWRPLLLLKFYRGIIRQTNKWRKIYADYYGKFLNGIQGNIMDNIKSTSVALLSVSYNNYLSRQYYKRNKNEKAIQFVRELANDLRAAFIKILKRNSWMSKKTKQKAIEKIEKLKFFIAEEDDSYTEQMFPDVLKVKYGPNSLWKNIVDAGEKNMLSHFEMNGASSFEVRHNDWGSYPVKIIGNKSYIVNAFYTFWNNSITVNLALLQPPFVDLDNMGLQYNLATIGFVIAHELSHALDSIGGKYNADGQPENWWAPEDLAKYKEIQEDIKKQYEEFAARDGIKLNANLSLSENLADISGLAICEEYLRDYLLTTKAIPSVVYLNFRIFYNYFAYNLRQYIPKEVEFIQLLINPHPPDVYRVNVPLTRSIVYRASFNIKKGDKMWWPNTNTIW